MQGDAKMCVSVVINSVWLAYQDICIQLFADFTAQTFGQALAAVLFPAGEFPQPAQQPLGGAASDQYLPGALDHRCGDCVMRHAGAGPEDRALFLHPGGMCLAPGTQWAARAVRGAGCTKRGA